MDEQLGFHPSGLMYSQLDRLKNYVDQAAPFTPARLLKEADKHLQEALTAYRNNRLVNIRLAEAIREVIEKIISEWEKLPARSQPWLAGAILYFVRSNDDEPDFTSAIGFEDDAEVLNACLRFAELDDLCLNPEDYDGI